MHCSKLNRLIDAGLHRHKREATDEERQKDQIHCAKRLMESRMGIEHIDIGCLNFFQSSSFADTHINTATKDTVPYIARTLKGIGG